jgi:hypothetical protein
MTQLTESQIEPGDLLIFADSETDAPIDESGGNQLGIAITNGVVVFCRRRRLVRVPTSKLLSEVRAVNRPTAPLRADAVVTFFEEHATHYRLFLAGLRAMREGNYRFFGLSPMPNAPRYSNREEFDEAWRRLAATAEPGDLIAVYDKRSWISRVIAGIDGGAWSHVAVCTASGVIDEALTSGITRRALQSYKSIRYHVGVYRSHRPIPDLEAGRQFADAHLGNPYNFRGALMLGVRTLLHLRTEFPTPNGLVYSGHFYLVDHA